MHNHSACARIAAPLPRCSVRCGVQGHGRVCETETRERMADAPRAALLAGSCRPLLGVELLRDHGPLLGAVLRHQLNDQLVLRVVPLPTLHVGAGHRRCDRCGPEHVASTQHVAAVAGVRPQALEIAPGFRGCCWEFPACPVHVGTSRATTSGCGRLRAAGCRCVSRACVTVDATTSCRGLAWLRRWRVKGHSDVQMYSSCSLPEPHT